jgi:paspaline synthase
MEHPIFDYVAITARALCGICWVITYVLMIHKSFQQRTYSIPIITLLFNIGWELIYTLVYGKTDVRSQGIVRLWPLFNLAVLGVTIKFAPNEWEHSPVVRRNIPLLFVLGLAWSLSGHWALASEMGPALAFYWSGAGCQILTSVGLLCQLLCRGSTRGSSYLIW